jgi:Histidine kinase-, DNA gyrase B-, and HSP90-like ATPase
MKFDRPNDPNAGRLIESLRYLGYGNYEAIADLVDNSIDAEATKIHVSVQHRESHVQIAVADDGDGMDMATLDQAMRLGSLTARDVNSDLGKFGMGLVTASLSIAKRCHVVTKTSDGYVSSAWDVDEISAKNSFCKHLDKATAEEKATLDHFIGQAASGTVLLLTKCDNLTNRNTTSFAKTLASHLARTHRYFIESGREIFVNDEKLSPVDPLQLTHERTEVVIDEVFQIAVDDATAKRTENVRVRIVLVPEATSSELDIGRSMKAQGFYVMRNLREVMSAVTLNFFTKHNDFNRMRGELFFPGTLDRWVGIEFTKRQVNLDQSVFDQLAATLIPTCRTIKRREATKKRVQTGSVQKEVHERAAKTIAEKDKLLIKPKARIERRASPGNTSQPKPSRTGEPERERRNFARVQSLDAKLNCEIREERLGPNGQIYECDLEGKKIVLRYNVEHPFYQKFVVDNLDDTRLVTTVDFLIYSMASAELRMLDDGIYDAANNFKAVMSANLRTLLN